VHSALVLAGGAARGAYEVGVVRYVLEEVARSLGKEIPLDILCGTSVGAINVCALAAWADAPRERGRRLERAWTSLEIADVIQPAPREVWHMLRALVGKPAAVAGGEDARRGGLVDPVGLERLIRRTVRFQNIGAHLKSGLLRAVSVSATHVASGITTVFVETARGDMPGWGADTTVEGRAVALRAEHALASAAIPLIFPAVRVDGHFYADGGLRQNVPLSPARRLGARRLLVVSPRHLREVTSPVVAKENEAMVPSPLFLFGKTLNALLLDRIDADLDRLNRINHLVAAGTEVYGADFLDRINLELIAAGHGGVRPLATVLVRASEDIGAMAAAFVRSPEFARRARGLVARLVHRLAEGEARHEADLLSYILFDGGFARQLIELGHKDAAAQHEELCALFAG
jgi:NTE family protein